MKLNKLSYKFSYFLKKMFNKAKYLINTGLSYKTSEFKLESSIDKTS